MVGSFLGGFPVANVANPGGNLTNFGHVRFPGNVANCETCHIAGTYAVPERTTGHSRLEERTCTEDPAADADDFCQDPFWVITATITLPPATAVCTSCHDSFSAAAHAQLNTTPDGAEACAVCHGPGRGFDVEIVHGE